MKIHANKLIVRMVRKMDKQQEAWGKMFEEALTVFNGRDHTPGIIRFIEEVISKANVEIPTYEFRHDLNAVMLACYTMGVQFPYYIDVNTIIRTLDDKKGSGATALPFASIKTIEKIVHAIDLAVNDLLIQKMIKDGYIKLISLNQPGGKKGGGKLMYENIFEELHIFREHLLRKHKSVSIGVLASPIAMHYLEWPREEYQYYIKDIKRGTTPPINSFDTMQLASSENKEGKFIFNFPISTMNAIPHKKIGIVAICSGYETVTAQDKYPEWVDIILKHGNTI